MKWLLSKFFLIKNIFQNWLNLECYSKLVSQALKMRMGNLIGRPFSHQSVEIWLDFLPLFLTIKYCYTSPKSLCVNSNFCTSVCSCLCFKTFCLSFLREVVWCVYVNMWFGWWLNIRCGEGLRNYLWSKMLAFPLLKTFWWSWIEFLCPSSKKDSLQLLCTI